MSRQIPRNPRADTQQARAFRKLRAGNLLADSVVFNEVPGGAVDGSNNTFTLADVPEDGTLMVFVNGLLMREGSSDDFSLAGKTITFHAGAVPGAGEWIRVMYRRA
jgi:hypothetical protein